MKRYLMVVLGVLSFSRMCGAGELHEFRVLSGKSVKAEVIGYNGRLDMVTLKLPNKSIKKVRLGLFVAEDREYVIKWSFVSGFKNNAKFKIKINKKSGGVERVEARKGGLATIKKTRYDIVLENLNSFPLENISVEYKIFIRTKGDGRWLKDLVKLLGSKSELVNPTPTFGAKECGEISPSETILVETKYARSIKAKPGSRTDSSGEAWKNQELVLEGIWVRVVMEIDGETIFRDVFAPDILKGKHTWD